DAKLVFEGQPDDVAVQAQKDQTKGFEREFVERAITFWTNEMFLRRDGKLIKIDKPDDAIAFAHREFLFLQLRTDWKVGDKTHPAGALLAANFDDYLSGKRNFDILFQPTERKSLAGVGATLHHVIVNELDNVRNRVFVLTHNDGSWKRVEMSGVPEF